VVPDTAVSLAQFGQAAVLSIFVISGFEMLCIPAGEASNPQRDVPRALLVSLMAGVALIVTANVVAIGGRMHTTEESFRIVNAFLATPFSGAERHQRRIDQLAEYEAGRTTTVSDEEMHGWYKEAFEKA